jgi:hypothetical protein
LGEISPSRGLGTPRSLFISKRVIGVNFTFEPGHEGTASVTREFLWWVKRGFLQPTDFPPASHFFSIDLDCDDVV